MPTLIEEIAGLAPVRILDLKGHYRGTPVDVETDPELYRMVAEAFPDAYIEDPDLNAKTKKALGRPHGPRHLRRAAALARRRQGRWPGRRSTRNRLGSARLRELLEIYEYCEREGIAVYGGGQGEVQCGRGQIQYLASLFHPSTPNDTAPSGYNDPAVPDGHADQPDGPLAERNRLSLGLTRSSSRRRRDLDTVTVGG